MARKRREYVTAADVEVDNLIEPMGNGLRATVTHKETNPRPDIPEPHVRIAWTFPADDFKVNTNFRGTSSSALFRPADPITRWVDTGGAATREKAPARPEHPPATPAPAQAQRPPLAPAPAATTAASSTATEITDLPSAIGFTGERAAYAEMLTGLLAEFDTQLAQALDGLTAEAAQYERARPAFSVFKDGSKRLDRCLEAFTAATDKLQASRSAVADLVARVTEARDAMTNAHQLLNDQRQLSDQLEAARAAGGVARRTAAYNSDGAGTSDAPATTPAPTTTPAPAAAPGPVTGQLLDQPLVRNGWDEADESAPVFFHDDGTLGQAIQFMGDDAQMDVDGEPLGDVIGKIATDVTFRRCTTQQAIDALAELRDRLPKGSMARMRVASAVDRMDAPMTPLPTIPDGTPEPLVKLVRALHAVPMARDGHWLEIDPLMEIIGELAAGDTEVRHVLRDIERLANQRHEGYGDQGKFEIDFAITDAVESLREEPPANGPEAIVARLRQMDKSADGEAYLDELGLDREGLLAVAAASKLTRVDRLSLTDLRARVLKQNIGARRKFEGLRKW